MKPASTFDWTSTVRAAGERPAPDLIAQARALGTATLHEACGRRGALPAAIRPTDPGFRICGPALTVHSPGGDNLWLHRALTVARPGDVLVAFTSDSYEFGYWGDIMSTAAARRGLGGVVIDGCVRDADEIVHIGLPVFARGLCIRGSGKDFGARGWINAPIRLGDVTIHSGDLIAGDRDGVLAVPSADVAAVVAGGIEREKAEVAIRERLAAGESTLHIYGWD